MILNKQLLLASTAAILVATAAPALAQDASTNQEAAQTAETSSDVIVTGIRKSLQDAAEVKRKSSGIVDVVSAEAVGKFPDRNVAESLSHLPGVTVDHQFGEGEQVSIAGTEPALNRVLIDGHSIASADWGGNPGDRSSRSFNYSLLASDIIQQAEVHKTPEARIDEGSLGATVIIRTRKPLDLKANTFSFTGGVNYNDRSGKADVRASGLYSWHNADDTFGVLGAITYDKVNLSRAGVAVYGYQYGKDWLLGSYPTDANGAIIYDANGNTTGGAKINGATANRTTVAALSAARFPFFLAHEYFQQTRQREGLSGAVQWRPTPDLELTATALVIRGKYDNFSQSEFSYDLWGKLLTSATVQNGLVTSATYAANPRPALSGTGQWNGEFDTNFRRTRIKNDSFNLAGSWTPGDWDISANGGYTRASGGKSPEYLLSFRTRQGFTVGALGRNTSLNWDTPASDGSQWVGTYPDESAVQSNQYVLAANGGKSYTGAQIGGITYADQTVDKEKYGQIDFSHDLGFGPFAKLLFGAKYSDHDNSQTTSGGATYTNQAFSIATLNPVLTDSGLYDGLSTTGNATPFATITKETVIATLTGPNTLNVTFPLDAGSFFRVNEKILAGYVQANIDWGQLRGDVGGRFVKTQDKATFFLQGSTLTTVDRSYFRFLPNLNLAYDVGEGVVLRGGAAKVIARPRYSDLAGATSLDDTTLSGGGGNPDLKPYEATNFGLSAEWYFKPGSYISGEVFYRDISNYISNQTSDQTYTNPSTGRTLTYNISSPINGGKASVTGFALTGQANVIWGFGIQTNYTFTSAEVDSTLGNGLPYLSRNTWNIIPYYENGPLQVRLSYNYRSKYFYRYGRAQSSDFTDAYTQLDLSASLKVNRNILVTASALNLLDETYYQYSSDKSAPTSLYKNGRTFSLTASFKM